MNSDTFSDYWMAFDSVDISWPVYEARITYM